MFGIGFAEILIILLVFIVLVNPKDLPRLFRWLGRLVRQLRELKDSSVRYLRKVEREIEKADKRSEK
jgi:Tat protein translocase TatB subunit